MASSSSRRLSSSTAPPRCCWRSADAARRASWACPGEDLPKVVYRLIDPEQYRGRQIIVVGGGDSALEAAASVAELGDTQVILSYRGEAFQRAKTRNRERVEEAASKRGTLKVHAQLTDPARSAPKKCCCSRPAATAGDNDAVIVNAGGILPNDFLRSIGIEVETKYGTA